MKLRRNVPVLPAERDRHSLRAHLIVHHGLPAGELLESPLEDESAEASLLADLHAACHSAGTIASAHVHA